MKPTVELYHVWKQYAMTGLMGRAAAAFFPNRRPVLGKGRGWALKDVSLELKPGARLGAIGRNGAGKTTLLRLLANITRPSSGKITTRGRVAALIALGAGFHAELTGRENIVLNGTILGYSRAKLRKRVDDIIAFAELGDYIDTPVKFYSSGMYARLGFSVAVHVEPEILLVDEVLSVGDVAFQMKSFDRMKQFCESGCTIVFVSHRMAAVTTMCDQALWLDRGVVREIGDAREVTRHYLEEIDREATLPTAPFSEKRASPLTVTGISLLNGDGICTDEFHFGDTLIVRLHYQAHRDILQPWFIVWIENRAGPLFNANMAMDGLAPSLLRQGEGYLDCVFPNLPLKTGAYYVGLRIRHGLSASYFETRTVAQFKVVSLAQVYGYTTELADAVIRDEGASVYAPYTWRICEGGKLREIGSIGMHSATSSAQQ